VHSVQFHAHSARRKWRVSESHAAT
jgi:hypothetical protein